MLLLAVGAIGPFYASRLLTPWRTWMYPGSEPGLERLAAPLYVHHALMSSRTVYVATSLLLTAMLILALRHASSTTCRAVCAVALVATVMVPVVFRYTPPVVAKPGLEMRWPTRPGPLAGVSKRCQIVFDTSTHYQLLGWSPSGELIYRRDDDGGLPGGERLLAYEPELDRLRTIGPDGVGPLEGQTAHADSWLNPSPDWSERLGHTAYTRQHAYASPYDWMIPEAGLASPDGRWIAARARHAIYRAEDIVLVRQPPGR
ncbi:MAG: hypothetical protein H6648_07375 [Caldilineae bacterium]|nr:hypothetical protein [Chloroflexota bacterium]MCB9176964.1 hypothetical protein [Caldilineae bacterium]